MVKNSPKVTKKVLVFRKVARSCSLTKKLFKILKFAKKLPSRIWKGLLRADWSAQLRQWARTIKAFPVIAVIEPNMFPAPIKMNMANGHVGGGGLL